MRICVVAADKGGCGYYRMRWPAEALMSQGFNVQLSDAEDLATTRADQFDVIVIQRPLKRKMYAHVQSLQKAGIAVVVDIDDDFACVPKGNINYERLHPRWNPDSNFANVSATCSIADFVTVATPALARRYGLHGRVALLPNCVPEWYLSVPHDPNERLTLGWSGTVETHPGDLEETGGAVAHALIDNPELDFRVVGTGYGVAERLRFPDDRSLSYTGWLEITGPYQRGMAGLDLGIVPLARNAFNESKSWLKGLEWAALGVPVIASDTPEYKRLEEFGGCVTAKRFHDWRRLLTKYTEDETARKNLAKAGRETAAKFTYQKLAWRWAEAWAAALEHRRGKVAA